MTNEEVMALMFDMGLHDSLEKKNWIPDNAWVLFANRVAAHEREECAKLCEAEIERVRPLYSVTAENCTKGIRARGEKCKRRGANELLS
jgi:hypothetical protein